MREFQIVDDEFRKHPEEEIILPLRATSGSAGYDIKTPRDVTIEPHSQVLIFTDIKIKLPPWEVLSIYPRSSLGVKKGLSLANTVGIIDSDYYNNEDTGGNIGVCLYNKSDTPVTLEKGENIVQGIITSFLLTTNDNTNSDTLRTGGFGSTDKK